VIDHHLQQVAAEYTLQRQNNLRAKRKKRIARAKRAAD
jgi:hypothetical protein